MKKIILIMIGIFLISFTSAINITAGDSYIIPYNFTEDFSYYKIINNVTPIDINVTQNQSVVTIEFSKYMKTDSFDIIFYNYKDEPMTHSTSSGGKGGPYKGGTVKEVVINDTIDETVNETIEDELPDIIEEEVEEIVKEKSLVWFIFKMVIGISIIGIVTYIIIRRSKRNEQENFNV